MELECTVGFTAGAYVTNTVRGERASSTHGANAAAESLGRKLFGPAFTDANFKNVATRRGLLHDVYGLVADDQRIAFCWQSGLIEVGLEVPEGAIAFAKGPERALEEKLGVLARHGQGASTGKLLVPGVPEADSPEDKVDALIAWVEWCAKRNGKGNYGVVSSRDRHRLVAHLRQPQGMLS